MSAEEIVQQIKEALRLDKPVEIVENAQPPTILIEASRLLEASTFLHKTEGLYFDYLSCITGIDNGPEAGTMEVIYTLNSIPYEQQVSLKVLLQRNVESEPLPEVPSVVSVWKSAEWHEREIYDLLGIHFTNHPDLRRILMPTDWPGYPLRKDYQEPESYHGIGVKYED